jgi:dihydrofolate reductase
MTRVICDMSASLDGYVTGPNDSRENPFGDGAGMLHDWMFAAATEEARAIVQDILDSVGAVVMGRTSFEKNEGDGGWGDGGPLGDTPCFVVTHHEPTRAHPSIYTFVYRRRGQRDRAGQEGAGDKVLLGGLATRSRPWQTIAVRAGDAIEGVAKAAAAGGWCGVGRIR